MAKPKLSQRLQDEWAFVERTLGDYVICERCGTTMKTRLATCTADFDDPCPGYLAIERAKRSFQQGAQ